MIDTLPVVFVDSPVDDVKVPPLSKTGILLKVATVALAAIAFFTIQQRQSLGTACAIAGTMSTLTGLSEYYLRQDPSFPRSASNWFNTQSLHGKELVVFFCGALCANLIAGIIFSFMNISIGQHVQELIKKRDLRILLIATVIAPFCEEILFRGFLKERIEDACALFSRFVKPLSDDFVEQVSHLGQSLIFGYAHIHPMQTLRANILIFFNTSLIGFSLGSVKDYCSTLVSPICIHMTINTTVTARLLLFGH